MKRDNIELICSIGELAGLFKEQTNIEGFLQQVVRLITEHMDVGVCSIYLRQQADSSLLLMASVGLPQEFIGKLRLKPDEGITGRALKELRPLRIPRASASPYYKYIPGMKEEKYEAFLAVPIIHGLDKVGVISLQHPKPDYFTREDARALSAIASQLAATLENARLLLEFRTKTETVEEPQRQTAIPRFLKCKNISSGLAFGSPIFLGHHEEHIYITYSAEGDENKQSLENFLSAMDRTEKQLEDLQMAMETKLSEVGTLIFSSHLLMLRDEAFSGMMIERIQKGSKAGEAIVEVVNTYADLFHRSGNTLVQEKVHDVKDLGHRLLRNLEQHEDQEGDYSRQIILAKEILPSDLIKLAAQHAEGFVLYGVTAASHVSILARSLNIPVVVTDAQEFFELGENDFLVIDANQGNIFINPDNDLLEKYQQLKQMQQELDEEPAEEFLTADGTPVTVLANINLLSDISIAKRLHAQGIGLYRSEFPFIIRKNYPSEEEQFDIYSRIFNQMSDGQEIVLRTLDIGGDKILSYQPDRKESNPFLGLRAIRFLLKNKDIFETQIRAMLRAGYKHDCRIMFPLISSLDDFLEAKAFVEECITGLKAEGTPHHPNPKIGSMIELPSAVEIIEDLAGVADFVSIGTNDLVQYLIGIDRTNEYVSAFYTIRHPAVLKVLERVIRISTEVGCDVSVCGDAACDLKILEFLVGAGLRKISIGPRQIPAVRNAIGSISIPSAFEKMRRVLQLKTIAEVEAELDNGR